MDNLRYSIIAALLVTLMVLPNYVFADSGNQLDTTLVPTKLIANTDGIIEVYPKDFNGTIDNLVATSSDSSTVQILGVEKDTTHNVFNVKIKALNSGQATISMAAPGFVPLEVPVTIYSDSYTPTTLLIKATPQTFSTTGPNGGYVSVETVNSDGVPTPVSEDTTIKLSVSDSSIATLDNGQMIIKQGSYFATEKFGVSKPGTVQIYASASSMQPVSTSVTVNNEAVQYTLQAYAYPSIVNVAKNSLSYIIVQLHDAAGNPVLAKNDIPVSVRVVNPNDTSSINTSGQSPFAQVNSALVIQKGSYWGYVPVAFSAGVNATYNIAISATGYAISTIPATMTVTTSTTTTTGTTAPGSSTTTTGTTTTTTTTSASGTTNTTSTISTSGTTTAGNITATGTTTASSKLISVCARNPIKTSTSQIQIVAIAQNFIMDDKTPCFYPLPVLATGNNELIGVLALKDSQGYPALTKSNLSFEIDSSDTSTVSIPDVKMGYGVQSALVFAKVGKTANPVTFNVVSGSPQQITPVVAATTSITSGLVANSLLATVLTNTPFPLAIYTTNNGALIPFTNNLEALISPQESISPIQQSVTRGGSIFLANETLLKSGTQSIAITTADYSSGFTIVGASSKPSSIMLGYPNQIFSNNTLLFSIELLDDKQLPILADKDINLKLVSSDPAILTVPDIVQIKKGSYYATFDADARTGGTAQMAVLADELPLSKLDVTVTSFTPVLTIASNDYADNNSPLAVTVAATYNNLPVAGLYVDWQVTGATIQAKDSMTDKDGKATLSLLTDNPNRVTIQASAGGGPYQTVSASKQVSINSPLLPATQSPSAQGNTQPNGFSILGFSPILFVIPGVAAAAFVVLKKKNMLEGISERINISERFSEMIGRVSRSQE